MASTTAPSLFLRNATGLVKGWSGFDAFAYSFMSVNLVTLGMFYSLAIFAYVPDGSAIASVIVTAIVMTFMVIAYAGLIALGMAGYARIQRICLWIGLAALAVMFVLMLITTVDTFKPAYDKAVQGMFGVSNAYQATIDQAASDP